jgi:hypothetical protein
MLNENWGSGIIWIENTIFAVWLFIACPYMPECMHIYTYKQKLQD